MFVLGGLEQCLDKENPQSTVIFAVVFYTLCSSVMLVANKVALSFNPLPALVICLQIAATISSILVLRAAGLSQVDEFDWPRVKEFLPYMVSFVLALYSSGRAIQNSNVETVIVFKACTPMLVAVLDYVFLGRQLPSTQSWMALGGMAGSVIGYVLTDSEFLLNGVSTYGWVTLYVLAVVFESTYGKRLCQNVKFNAPVWGQVMYCNVLGFFPLLGIGLLSGEGNVVVNKGIDMSSKASFALFLTCVVGVGIAWAVWNCRNQVSAASFAVIGVVCKMISVFMNVAIWDKHASLLGIVWCFVCLLCSSAYRQAPPVVPEAGKVAAEETSPAPGAGQESDEELSKLTDAIGRPEDAEETGTPKSRMEQRRSESMEQGVL